jgi:uncharacterized protein
MVDSNREELLASDEAYRRLAQEHASYEQRLDALTHKSRLSDDELMEEIRLKKLKLKVKDEMQNIERLRRPAASAA